MKKEKPDFKMGETAMYVWATELKDDDHLAEAIDVLKLELQILPAPAMRTRGCGETYQKSGEKQLAVESYKKALEKNPRNSEAKEKLAVLEALPATK